MRRDAVREGRSIDTALAVSNDDGEPGSPSASSSWDGKAIDPRAVNQFPASTVREFSKSVRTLYLPLPWRVAGDIESSWACEEEAPAVFGVIDREERTLNIDD